MNLETQIQSLIASFIFGMFFSLTYNTLHKYLYVHNLLIKIFNNFIYIIVNVTIYFITLQLINNGIIHPYFLISSLLGFIIGNKTTKKVRSKQKQKII